MADIQVEPPPIYLGDPTFTLEELEKNVKDHRDLRDVLNSWFGNDPIKNSDTIDWAQREKDGLIEDGVFKTTWRDRLIGVSQPEGQLGYETWRQKKLKKQAIPINAAFAAEGRKPVEITTATNSATLAAEALQLENLVKNRDTLVKMPGGPEAFAALGDNPTNTQILGAISARQAENDKPEKQRKKQLFQDELDTNKSQRDANTAARKLARDQFDLNKQSTAENQNFREWQAQDQSAYRKFQEQEATRRIQYENDNRVADRNLQMQLAEMNRDERGEIRREDRRRDAKKDRQLMLLQLINGLKQVGQGFGG